MKQLTPRYTHCSLDKQSSSSKNTLTGWPQTETQPSQIGRPTMTSTKARTTLLPQALLQSKLWSSLHTHIHTGTASGNSGTRRPVILGKPSRVLQLRSSSQWHHALPAQAPQVKATPPSQRRPSSFATASTKLVLLVQVCPLCRFRQHGQLFLDSCNLQRLGF